MDFFGFEFKKKAKDDQPLPSVVSPSTADGSIVVDSPYNGLANAGGYFSYGVDLEGVVKNDNELIRRYREISLYPEVDFAINDICNEAIVSDQEEKIVSLNLDELKTSDQIKKKMSDCFDEVLSLLDFNNVGAERFRQWYVDGKIYYHIMFKDNSPRNGISEIRLIDPLKIKKIKNIKREKLPTGVEVIKSIEEYYIYNDKGIHESSMNGIKLTLDSVVEVTSGLIDGASGSILSHLQKTIKPANQLKMMEDALVIYRMSRAPERRIFYIDVGSMPKLKAEEYVNDMMNKFRNKLVYDAKTGELTDSKKHLSMMEDFWMPRRDSGKGTEITSLPGGQNLGQIDDIQYFLNKLYRSLNVPITRLQPETGFTIGRSNEISREEVRFSKFIDKLRSKFSNLFLDILKIQLITKGIVDVNDWKDISQKIKFDYSRDNFFTELKETEILNNRLQALTQVDPYVGKYFSRKTVLKKILRMTDEEINNMEKENSEDPFLKQEADAQEGEQ
jgi:hypothetical protein